MTPDEIRAAAFRVLAEIAPEADATRVRPDVSLRTQIDLDSMDYLNFVIALHKALGVEVPEADYPRLTTLDGCVAYFSAAGPSGQRPG